MNAAICAWSMKLGAFDPTLRDTSCFAVANIATEIDGVQVWVCRAHANVDYARPAASRAVSNDTVRDFRFVDRYTAGAAGDCANCDHALSDHVRPSFTCPEDRS